LTAARVLQRFRFHLIFGVRIGIVATVMIWLLIGLFEWTSSTWMHSTDSLLRALLRSFVAFLGFIHIIPHFIGLTLCGSMTAYVALMFAQWFVVGFAISLLFRSRHWFFNSSILFWLLFPLTFVPLILPSSGTKYWCGFGIGQPWEWLYYCENVGATSFSLPALFGEIFIGLAAVILMRRLAKIIFCKRES